MAELERAQGAPRPGRCSHPHMSMGVVWDETAETVREPVHAVLVSWVHGLGFTLRTMEGH